jgi:hypothetical protein
VVWMTWWQSPHCHSPDCSTRSTLQLRILGANNKNNNNNVTKKTMR